MNIKALNKNGLMLFVALVFGCFSAWAIERHLTRKTNELESRAKQSLITRVVAAQDLKKGTLLNLDHFALRDFNDPLHGLHSVEASQVEVLTGKVLNQDVIAGQLIPTSLTSSVNRVELSSRLQAGMRALTIPVDQINSLSGLLRSDDIIDLLVSFDHEGKRITSPLLTGILVIATGREIGVLDTVDSPSALSHSAPFDTVTLATTAEQAIKLVAARQAGSITAVLSQKGNYQVLGSAKPELSGHLAKLLGIEVQQETIIPVYYGDRSEPGDLQLLDASQSLQNPQSDESAHAVIRSSERKY